MDFQFFEIQFFEKTMKNNEKTMKHHEKTMIIRFYPVGRERGSWSFTSVPEVARAPWGPGGPMGPKGKGPKKGAQRKGTKGRDHIH